MKLSAAYDRIEFNFYVEDLFSAGVKVVYLTYVQNCNRAANILHAAAFFGYIGEINRAAHDRANIAVFGEIDPSAETTKERAADLLAAYREEAQKIVSISSSDALKLTSDLVKITNAYLPHNPSVHADFDGLFISMILLAWSALEIMMEDLWVAALNEGPKSLSEIEWKGSGKPTLTDFLRGVHNTGSYDLSKSMGTVLKSLFSFSKVADRTTAYDLAFKDGARGIVDAINNPRILALMHLRNQVAHAGLKLDKNFFNKTESLGHAPNGILKPVRDLGLGGEMTLDGQFIKDYAWSAMVDGCKIIGEVDKWLEANS